MKLWTYNVLLPRGEVFISLKSSSDDILCISVLVSTMYIFESDLGDSSATLWSVVVVDSAGKFIVVFGIERSKPTSCPGVLDEHRV